MHEIPTGLPLLHVGQTALRVTTFDFRLILAGIVLFALIAARIWLSPRRRRAFWRRLRRASPPRVALGIVVFLAVLPAVLPYDHLLPFAGHAAADAEQETTHASHCHISPGTCSDAPLTSGPGQLLMGAPWLTMPSMLTILLLLTIPALAGITRRPDLRPPLLATWR